MKKNVSYGVIIILLAGLGLKSYDSFKQTNQFELFTKKQRSSLEKIKFDNQNAFISAAYAEEAQTDSEPQNNEADTETTEITKEEKCITSESMLALIQEERLQLQTLRQEIDEKDAKLELAKARVELEIQNLQKLRNDLNILLEKREKMQTADVERLINLYKNMKPKDAARLMNGIDPEVSVMVLGTMSERSAAPILANMNATRAQAISKIILERSKLPGDQKLDNIKIND
jgi:flagellar motility protein MotE (MotC chaperone)